MIAHNDSLCRQATLYYYDFLYKENYGHIPEFIFKHLEECPDCQEQINQLKGVLLQADGIEFGQNQPDSAIVEMLALHFAYLGKHVTCKMAKPFLPSLLDPALEVRIPTPITIHLDNCQRCREDLKVIQGLNLNRIQLSRLSRVFVEKPSEDNISCTQAQDAIPVVVSMAFHETNAEVLEHLCICPDCREKLYQYREKVREELLHKETAQGKLPCEKFSTSDIFDYCLPYGIDRANDQYAKLRESLGSHLRTCPVCLAKMQQLHKAVCTIAERADSDIVTVCNIDKSAKAQPATAGEAEGLYSGFPIKVEILKRKDKAAAESSATTIDFGAALKQKISAMNLKPLVKTAVAVAAVILIASVLFLRAPAAKAVSIDQIYKAIEKVKNIYISSFVPEKTGLTQEEWVSKTLNIDITKDENELVEKVNNVSISNFVPDKQEPIQEQWVSRMLNFYILKTKRQLVWWDISKGVKKTKYFDSGATETTPLTDEVVAGIENIMSGYLGLMPFYDISGVPPGAEWIRIDADGLEAAEGIEVYELTWVEKVYDVSLIFKKWRVFVDVETNLPQRVEWYEKLPADEEFGLETTLVVGYLSDDEIQAVIRGAF